MKTFERTREVRHTVGADGEVVLRAIAAHVVVRGVDGPDARVVLRYALREPDEAAARRIDEAFDAKTRRAEGRFEVASGEGRHIAVNAGPFAVIARAIGMTLDEGMQIEAEVPRGADLRVETMSGSIQSSGMLGRQRYRTVSGRIRVAGAGELSLDTTSGDAEVDAPGDVRLDWHSVSGSLRARAQSYHHVRLDTMSGAMLLAGPLGREGSHRAHSVSGPLRLEAHAGLAVESRSLSGSIRSEVEHRLEGAPGRTVLVVGDGAVRLRYETVSGDLVVLRPSRPTAEVPGAPGGTVGNAASMAAAPPSQPEPLSQSEPPVRPEAPVPPETPARSGVPVPSAAGSDRLAILQAVERGEIDVDEAMRRLGEASDA